MADSQDDLLKQISVLKMKISGRLKLSHGEDVTTYIFSISGPNDGICDGDQDLHEQIRLFSSSESKWEMIEMDWLAHQLAIHRELEELDIVLTLFDFGDFLDQTPSLGSPVFFIWQRCVLFCCQTSARADSVTHLQWSGYGQRLHELLKLLVSV